MKRSTIFFVLLPLLLLSCNKNKVFDKHHDFDGNKWGKTDIVTFDADIDKVDQEYDIFVAVRHTTAYAFANVIVDLTIETPAGEKRTMQHSLIIRSADGKFLGDGLGDIYDISIPVFKKMLFKYPGKYKFTLENKMHLVEMPDLMSIGIIIKKS